MIDRIRKADPQTVLRGAMCAFTAAFLIGALLAPDRAGMLAGLSRICTTPAQLTRDYFLPELGGVSGAMLNCALVGAVCCALTFLPGAAVNGGTVLGFFLTTGFCTFGINPLNILPMLLGTFVYARAKGKPFGQCANFAMFSTGLAPLVSEVLFRYPGDSALHGITPAGILLALGIGVVVGCAMPPLCAHSPGMHKGYNLYNAGPAAGFLCMLLYAMMYKCRGVTPPAIGAELGEGHRLFVNAFCAICFLLCAAAGSLIGNRPGEYRKLLADSGFGADFTRKYGAGACLMNMGVYGLFILLYYNLIGASFTGPTMGAVFCMLACCCSGATPRNTFPIMLGYAAMGLLQRTGVTVFALNAQGIVVGLCFASGLAPVAGEYGVAAGVVAGMLHYCLVTSVPAIHGGFNLYNGGFTAGLVCFIFVPVLEHYFRRQSQRAGSKR